MQPFHDATNVKNKPRHAKKPVYPIGCVLVSEDQ